MREAEKKLKMNRTKLLYKYKSFSANSLSMLINKELYFTSPEQLNDPYDCQIDILSALESDVEIAEKKTNKVIKTKLSEYRSILWNSIGGQIIIN